MLERSWAKYFADEICPKNDEKPYAVLYSQKDSRPNTPVNVQIGVLIIKEFTGQSDDEIFESLLFEDLSGSDHLIKNVTEGLTI